MGNLPTYPPMNIVGNFLLTGTPQVSLMPVSVQDKKPFKVRDRIGEDAKRLHPVRPHRSTVMNAQELLQEIVEYCRRTGLAESTFGRRAVNDGKLANRLRNGGRITTETLDRIRAFMDANRNASAATRPSVIP